MQRFPFNWKTPFGYLSAFILLNIKLAYSLWIGACILALGIGLYFIMIAMNKSVKRNLFSIKRNVKNKINQEVIWKQFVEFFEFHSKVIKFSTKYDLKLFNSYKFIKNFY